MHLGGTNEQQATTEHTEGRECSPSKQITRKSSWTSCKVVPCVLRPWQQHSWSAGHARRRTHEGQRDSTHHRHLHTQSTPRWSKCPTIFRPPMHNKGGGHLPFGAQSNAMPGSCSSVWTAVDPSGASKPGIAISRRQANQTRQAEWLLLALLYQYYSKMAGISRQARYTSKLCL